jgi:translation initiation factor IF-3
LEVLSIATREKELSINNAIRAVQVRVIDDFGNQIGVMKTKDALDMAEGKGLDLVEIAPTAQIPVCRIMDYGKYKFEKSKKDKEAKKRQKQVIVETKETQLSWNIDIHDFNTRLNHTRKFIEAGNKVKISLELNRGREMAHIELGYQMIDKFEKACADFAVVEKRPIREGRRISMFIGPKKEKDKEKEKQKAPDKPAE